MIKKLSIILLTLILTLSGCTNSDYTEPEDRTVVTMLIIDKAEQVELTAETIILPKTKEGSGKHKFISEEGENIFDAHSKLKASVYDELSFYHCPIIVCGEEFYINNKNQISEFILSNEQFSLSANILVCEDVDNLQNIIVQDGAYLGYEISDYIEYKGVESKIIDIINNKTTVAKIITPNNENFEIRKP